MRQWQITVAADVSRLILKTNQSELTFAASATVKAPTRRGGSPRQAAVNLPVTESNCGGESWPWRATGSEGSVRKELAPQGANT
jgi:hypothetical protein